MLFHPLNFVVFLVLPVLFVLHVISPDMCNHLTILTTTVGRDPECLICALDNLPAQVCAVLASGTTILHNLAPDEGDFAMVQEMPHYSPVLMEETSLPGSVVEGYYAEPTLMLRLPDPSCTPWLLSWMLLVAVNTYFPSISSTFSFWTPVRAAIPALHWMISWWILPPGWEPSLVSLVPLSHRSGI
ncbi:hypothetical protein DSO57_1017324 [Entomophthora muscae]|uniref:Uncharacterized protein n=1 Tax=Entomophthora muscae TaxID=34485 RepID=A0ACC2RVT8_9FUNG|nr:hypothetical protein DSO57_1017324 [Entomophthora muscae]